MIPLPPDVIVEMWRILQNYDFKSTHGAFVGSEIVHDDIKARVLESAEIQVEAMGKSFLKL